MRVSKRISVLSSRVDIFSASQRIWFGTQSSRAVANQVIETREVFRPAYLATSEQFGGREVLQVLVVGQHEHNVCGSLQVVVPLLEGLENSQELLVVDLVVELGGLHTVGVEHDWVEVAIVGRDLGDDCCDRIVRSVSLNNDGIIRVEMCQDGCLCEGVFEGLKGLSVVGTPGEWCVLAGEAN